MRIELSDEYVITADPLNFVLNRQTIIQKGASAGQKSLEAIAFYPTLEGLGRSLALRQLRKSTAETIEQMGEQIAQIGKAFEEAILIQDGKESPLHVQAN